MKYTLNVHLEFDGDHTKVISSTPLVEGSVIKSALAMASQEYWRNAQQAAYALKDYAIGLAAIANGNLDEKLLGNEEVKDILQKISKEQLTLEQEFALIKSRSIKRTE